MTKKSPTQLSLDYLNKAGWVCAIVEKWNSFAKIRQDCFGFADILAYHPTQGIALIQTTTDTHFSHRRKKIILSPHPQGWCRANGRIFLHAWGDNGLREEEYKYESGRKSL